jgi:hypothetical protein
VDHVLNLKKIPEERALIFVLEYITKNPGAKSWEISLALRLDIGLTEKLLEYLIKLNFIEDKARLRP